MDRFPALVLAGGKTSPEFAAEAGVENRALAEIEGLPMVRYVLRALREARSVDRILLVAPEGFPDQPEADLRVTAEGTVDQNIQAALGQCRGAEFVLISTADIPFLTAEAVDDYVRRCLESGADCCYAAVTEEACRKQFPGMRRTWLHTPDFTVTGGNMVFQRVSAFARQAETLRRAYRSRKNPVFLAKLIGPGNVLKLLRRRLTLADIEAAASRVMGSRCRLIVTPYAEVGTDIDRPEDLRLAREILQGSGSGVQGSGKTPYPQPTPGLTMPAREEEEAPAEPGMGT